MLLRCKTCDVLMGLRPPFDDWTTDSEVLCAGCAYVHLDAQAFPSSAQIPADTRDQGGGQPTD